jgi:hypothetical protein
METKYQKKALIRAWQIGSGVEQPPWVVRGVEDHRLMPQKNGSWIIASLEGPLTAPEGLWIAQNPSGEFYPIAPEVFEATYGPRQVAEEQWSIDV